MQDFKRSNDIWWRPDLERRRGRWRDEGVFCRQSTGLGNELDVRIRGEPRLIPNSWFEKLADGGTILKTKRKGGLWEGET